MTLEQIKERAIGVWNENADKSSVEAVYAVVTETYTTLQAEHEREMGELVQEILQPPHFMFGTPTGENTIEMKQAVDVLKIKAIATRRGLLKVTGGEK